MSTEFFEIFLLNLVLLNLMCFICIVALVKLGLWIDIVVIACVIAKLDVLDIHSYLSKTWCI